MEKKYRIEFDGKELVFESEKEFKKFKAQCYNIHCDIMIDSQLNKGKVIKKTTGHTPDPEITLKDVLMEMREGFRKVNERLDKVEQRLDQHDLRFEKIEGILVSYNLRFEKIEGILVSYNLRFEKIEGVLERNNLN